MLRAVLNYITLHKRRPNLLWCKIKVNKTETACFFTLSTNLQTTKYFIGLPNQQQCSVRPTNCTGISWSFVSANGQNSGLLKCLVVRAAGFTGSDVSDERTPFSLKRQMDPKTWRHILNCTGVKVTSCVSLWTKRLQTKVGQPQPYGKFFSN